MSEKESPEFFEGLKKVSFFNFMSHYRQAIFDFESMMEKCEECYDNQKDPSKAHMARMRCRSLDLEKLGKQFRERTVAMEKKK